MEAVRTLEFILFLDVLVKYCSMCFKIVQLQYEKIITALTLFTPLLVNHAFKAYIFSIYCSVSLVQVARDTEMKVTSWPHSALAGRKDQEG